VWSAEELENDLEHVRSPTREFFVIVVPFFECSALPSITPRSLASRLGKTEESERHDTFMRDANRAKTPIAFVATFKITTQLGPCVISLLIGFWTASASFIVCRAFA
jgi:hypothetical protein